MRRVGRRLVSLIPRRRASRPGAIGHNICHLEIIRVGGRRIDLRFCQCLSDLHGASAVNPTPPIDVDLIVDPSYECSTCSGCSSLTEESLESFDYAFPCVLDYGSEAACSEAPSIGKPRKHKVCHIAFNDLVQTIEVPYSWEHDLWGG